MRFRPEPAHLLKKHISPSIRLLFMRVSEQTQNQILAVLRRLEELKRVGAHTIMVLPVEGMLA